MLTGTHGGDANCTACAIGSASGNVGCNGSLRRCGTTGSARIKEASSCKHNICECRGLDALMVTRPLRMVSHDACYWACVKYISAIYKFGTRNELFTWNGVVVEELRHRKSNGW